MASKGQLEMDGTADKVKPTRGGSVARVDGGKKRKREGRCEMMSCIGKREQIAAANAVLDSMRSSKTSDWLELSR